MSLDTFISLSEQKPENLHGEKNHLTTKNRPRRLFNMLKDVERKHRAKKRCPKIFGDGDEPKKQYKPQNIVSCELCDKTFAHKGALTMHKKNHII